MNVSVTPHKRTAIGLTNDGIHDKLPFQRSQDVIPPWVTFRHRCSVLALAFIPPVALFALSFFRGKVKRLRLRSAGSRATARNNFIRDVVMQTNELGGGECSIFTELDKATPYQR